MRRFLLIIIIAIPLIDIAQMRDQFTQFEGESYVGYRFDDDFLFIDNRDEQYTGGVELEWLKPLHKVKIKRGIFNPFTQANRTINTVLGSTLYTPYNVSDSSIILNDRPFSSYIYASIGLTSFNLQKTKRLTTEFYLGIMGASLPGKIQAALHTIGDSAPANGWHNKIAPKKQLVPNLKVNYQKSIISIQGLYFLNFSHFQYIHNYRMNAGLYLNNISFGPKIMLYNHKPNIASINQIIRKKSPISHPIKHQISIYFNPQIQLVAYNTSLQGLHWFNSPYVITPDLINRQVWVLEGGINYTYKKFYFNYSIQALSKEFKKYARNWHSWAGVNMGFVF